MTRTRLLVSLLSVGAAGAIAAGCGGQVTETTADTPTPATTQEAPPATTTSEAPPVPTVTAPVTTPAEGTTTSPETPRRQLSSFDFRPVCNGVAVPEATSYTASQKATHPVMLFKGKGDKMTRSILLPRSWRVRYERGKNSYAAVELVACAERVSQKFVKECTGYKSKGKPTGNKVRLFSAQYKLTVREATTAKELGSTKISAVADRCPSFVYFPPQTTQVERFAFERSPVERFLAKYVQRQ